MNASIFRNLSDATQEWTGRGRNFALQEKRYFALRRSDGMCYLLFVSLFYSNDHVAI